MSAESAVRQATGAHRTRRRRSRARPTWQLALAGLVLFGVTAGTIYYFTARHATVAPPAPAAPASSSAADTAARALSPDRVQRMIDEVTQRVQKDPKDSSAWALLAHSYDMLGKFDESSKAYAKLVELMPGNAQVLADYADALAVSKGRSFKGEPELLLRKALAADPKNLKALLLAGTDAFDRQAYGDAIGFWERARAVSTDAAVTRQIDSGLAEARVLATRSGASAPAAAAVARKPAVAVAGREVSGRVTLSPALQAKASPDDTVFIFARSTLGSRMPVALLRKKVRELPIDFRLDDSMAMVPEIKLSALSAVVVGARISKRGDATPHTGDLQGLSSPVTVGARGVQIQITEELP
jgi:cytochrome c-type biogenesis protein CcmH